MNALPRIISTLALATYLAAAFLPCEPPAWFTAGGSGHHAAAAEPTVPDEDPHAGHGDHHSTDGVVDGAVDGAVDGMAGHGSHSDHDVHRHDDSHRGGQPSVVPARGSTRMATAEIKPKCLCGCSETRSQVGGGTARLGSVVPGLYVVRLIEPGATRALAPITASFVDVHADLDPIPI